MVAVVGACASSEMIAKLNRQLDNQRYTMTDKKAQHLEMSALLANVDRLNHGRLEDQVRAGVQGTRTES